MTTLADVRSGIVEAVKAQTGLRMLAYPSSTVPHPCGIVTLAAYDPRLVLGRAKAEYPFRISVFLGPASERYVQIRSDGIREPSGDDSIVEALESITDYVDVDYAQVTLVGEPTEVVVNEETLMLIEFEIEVVF